MILLPSLIEELRESQEELFAVSASAARELSTSAHSDIHRHYSGDPLTCLRCCDLDCAMVWEQLSSGLGYFSGLLFGGVTLCGVAAIVHPIKSKS